MKAIAYPSPGPLDAPNPLVEVQLTRPALRPHDLLVDVRAVSVNPVDVKLRAARPVNGAPHILGYDAAGVVVDVGSDVTRFAVGDEVFYAGDISRPGTNAQLHAVDERIVGRKPSRLDFAHAAAMPLTSITAWELLFDSLGLTPGGGAGQSLLVIGGAGGVGSILIQLAKQLTDLTVIASASRPATQDWVRKMGADHIVNHRNALDSEMSNLGIAPHYVASLTHTDQHAHAIQQLIAPRGRLALIDDPPSLDIVPFKRKAVTIAWELMFTRSLFETADMHVQHDLLNRVSELIDAGRIQSTVTRHLGALTVANLTTAHAHIESGTAIGKTVLTGMQPLERNTPENP